MLMDDSPPPETIRPPTKAITDRFKTEASLLEQGVRRPTAERHGSRNGGSTHPLAAHDPK